MNSPSERVARLYAEHLNPGLARLMKFAGLEAIESHAEGVWVYDHDGNRYLDFLGGFGALNFGHRHPAIVAAVKTQLDKMPLSSRVLFNELQAELAAQLAALTPGDLRFCFFCHSGAEAVEACLKFARLATGRPKIVAMQNAYHGKTLGAPSALRGAKFTANPLSPSLIGSSMCLLAIPMPLRKSWTSRRLPLSWSPSKAKGASLSRPMIFCRRCEKFATKLGRC